MICPVFVVVFVWKWVLARKKEEDIKSWHIDWFKVV